MQKTELCLETKLVAGFELELAVICKLVVHHPVVLVWRSKCSSCNVCECTYILCIVNCYLVLLSWQRYQDARSIRCSATRSRATVLQRHHSAWCVFSDCFLCFVQSYMEMDSSFLAWSCRIRLHVQQSHIAAVADLFFDVCPVLAYIWGRDYKPLRAAGVHQCMSLHSVCTSTASICSCYSGLKEFLFMLCLFTTVFTS